MTSHDERAASENFAAFCTGIYARAPLELAVASLVQGIRSADPWNLSYPEAHNELLTSLLTAVCTDDRAEFSAARPGCIAGGSSTRENTIGDRDAYHHLMNAIRSLRTLLFE